MCAILYKCIVYLIPSIALNGRSKRGGASRLIPLPPSLPPIVDAPLINIETSTYADDWKAMIDKAAIADVEFVVESQVLYAHKIIICAASQLFRNILSICSDRGVDVSSAGGYPEETWYKANEPIRQADLDKGKVPGFKYIQQR